MSHQDWMTGAKALAAIIVVLVLLILTNCAGREVAPGASRHDGGMVVIDHSTQRVTTSGGKQPCE